jgi:hypothetical protein
MPGSFDTFVKNDDADLNDDLKVSLWSFIDCEETFTMKALPCLASWLEYVVKVFE